MPGYRKSGPAQRCTERLEALLKVTGTAKYAADHYPLGVLHTVIVGLPIAAGKLIAVDVAQALSVAGVVRVLTQSDMPRFGKVSPPASVIRLPMQGDRIEWEGQPVAIVIADSLAASEEAAQRIRIDIEVSIPKVPGTGTVEVPPEGTTKPHEVKGSIEAGLAEAEVTINTAATGFVIPQSVNMVLLPKRACCGEISLTVSTDSHL